MTGIIVPTPRYHKDQPIWWDFKDTRPKSALKTSTSQAGWIKEINADQNIAFITILTSERKEEGYAVSLDQIRPRSYA